MRALLPLLAVLAPLTAAAPAATLVVDADGLLGPANGFSATCAVDAAQTLGQAIDQALAAGCLDSVDSTAYPFGRYIDCINGLCNDFGSAPLGADGRFWIIYENQQSAASGMDDLAVDAGDVFHVSYDLCPVIQCVPNWAVP